MFPTSSSQSPNPPPSSSLLRHLSFNQDHSCFSAATPSGFRVFNSLPFRELFRRDFSPSSSSPFSIVSMLHHTNILALEMKLFLYAFHDFKLLRRVETVPNPKGLCALSQAADSMVIACPGLRKGQVRVEHCALKKVTFVTAHDSGISCLALTFDGKFLATASTRGTLIRVFDTYNATLLQEVRRGSNAAEIYSLAFDSNAQWLAVSSDKGTVHVFGLKIAPGMEHEKSQSSSNSDAANTSSGSPLSFIKFKGVLPKYFKSEWSFAQFRLPVACHHTVAFGHQKNTVMILGMDGSFYQCEFDPVRGGEMTQLEHHNILKPEIASEKIL